MAPKKFQRREVLAVIAGGMTGVAGCSTSALDPTSDSNPPKNGTATGSRTPTPSSSGATIPTYPYRETGGPPLNPKPDPKVLNPVLTAGHVTDVNAQFVADPFLFVTEDDQWHMFFEVATDKLGMIAHAKSDDRGVTWKYDQVVLRRPYHLSFPYVFKWRGTHYMTTEEGRSNPKARLYEATSFPRKWTHVTDLYDPTKQGHAITDHVLLQWDGRWWSLAGNDDGKLYAYHSKNLTTSGWQPHEKNPVVSGRPRAARPGGRPIVRKDGILMFYQDLKDYYGKRIRAYRITDLGPSSFADREVSASPVIGGTGKNGRDWNSVRMHQYDPWYLGSGEGWRAAVDGDGDGNDKWTIGIYRVPPQSNK